MRRTVTVGNITHKKYTHRVRYPGPAGKALQSLFKNETDAEDFAKKKRKELGQEGKAFGTLGRDEKAVVEFWRSFVERNKETPPPSLMDVVRDYADRWTATRSSVTVEKAVDDYQAAKEAEGLRAVSLQSLRTRCRRFAATFGPRPISSITSAEVSDWILGLKATRGPKAGKAGISLQAKRNHRLAVHALFAFAKSRGWVTDNPVTDAARPKPRKTRPGILRPGDVARFFATLETVAPEMLPFWSVRFFAGIREQEALRMDWSMIDLDAGEIHMPDTITKTGHPRTVKIEPALAAFLEPHKRLDGALCNLTPMQRRGRLAKVLKALATADEEAGKDARPFPTPMPNNAARHSYATYHLLAFRDAGETALQLGHGQSPALLHARYRGTATETEAKAFWKIRPAKKPDNVVPIKRRKRTTSAKKTTTQRKAR